ncbi:MAG: glycyl-radical enzyme activating protein [Bacillota bacterium]|nr:glycyl-radical enzyme activating protein [Bacillota bacterium]
MRVLNLQRMSTEDGPGLRTTVFFKGCPLRCLWCHNPESIPSAFGKEWIRQNCIKCGTCEERCPAEAVKLTDTGVVIDPKKCTECGLCTEDCPGNAMKPLGVERTVESLHKELVRDKAYFGKDGGVTFSGGEVLMQADDASRLAALLNLSKIQVAIDTAGFAPWETIAKLIPHAALFLYDLKLDDEAAHCALTGVANTLIKENLVRLSAAGMRLWIRTPVIPGATDGIGNIEAIASFLRDRDIQFERWELVSFNNLAKDKYARLGLDWPYKDTPLLKKATMDTLVGAAARSYGKPAKILWTGMTQREEHHE